MQATKTHRFKQSIPHREARRIKPVGIVEMPVYTPPQSVDPEPVVVYDPVTLPIRRDNHMPEPETHPWTIRKVTEAEIDEIMDWGLLRFQNRYPRCTAQSIRPMLVLATKGGPFNFLRTDDVVALWEAGNSPWEPQLTVYDRFVVGKEAGVGTGIKSSDVAYQALRLYNAGFEWAREIRAVEFTYGTDTEYEIEPIAKRIGYDHRSTGYTKFIVPVPALEPSLRMLAD